MELNENGMNKLNALFTLTIITMMSCSSPTQYHSYSAWDANSNQSLDRYEFVNSYTQSDYFDKWSDGKAFISYEDLYEGVFKSMDTDQDTRVSRDEFEAKIDHFYFGLFNGSFNSWDSDGNMYLNGPEFYKHVCKTNLASIWDTSDDKRISQREFAGGMFYLSDANSNGTVDTKEFNTWKNSRTTL